MNNIKYSYMDHWEIHTAAGLTAPGCRRTYLERYLKELRALGYVGLDTFAARSNSSAFSFSLFNVM